MRVIIEMEIETPDYDGKIFLEEINKLLEEIRAETGDKEKDLRLVKFALRDKYGDWTDPRDHKWRHPDYYR